MQELIKESETYAFIEFLSQIAWVMKSQISIMYWKCTGA